MDQGSKPMEQSRSTTPQGQGQGPSAMAEQQQAAAADTQAPAHSGAPSRTFHSLQAAQEHVRQQDGIITEQARNLGTLSNRMDAMSIQLAQLLSLVRYREVWGDRSADRDAASVEESADEDQNATSAKRVSGSKPILFPPESTPGAANTRQSATEVPHGGGNIHTDPDRQARREFLSRDRTPASPPVRQTGGIPHITPIRPQESFPDLFPQEDRDDGPVTAAQPRSQTVNVKLPSFYGRYTENVKAWRVCCRAGLEDRWLRRS